MKTLFKLAILFLIAHALFRFVPPYWHHQQFKTALTELSQQWGEPTDEDVMSRPPRQPTEPLLGRQEWFTIGLTAFFEAGVTLGVFVWALENRDLVEARNLAFSVLVFGELFRSLAARSATKVFWQVGALGNLKLLGVVVVSVLLQLAIHHMPWTQELFQIGTLSAADCLLGLGLGLVPVTVLELVKLARAAARRKSS